MVRVFKFGGALMKDADGIKAVGSVISSYSSDNLVVVISALGKTTNALEKLLANRLEENFEETENSFLQIRKYHFDIAESLIGDARNEVFDKLDQAFVDLNEELKNPNPDRYIAYDQTVCFGELLSSIVVEAYLKKSGVGVHLVPAHSIIVTNNNFTDAKIEWSFTGKAVEARVKPLLEEGEIVLTQGFIGADKEGNLTTLGREGSDFTAAILANILNADEVSIWKDVPGLMNADPKLFEGTVKLNQISYYEAIELAFYGASVVHPKTIQPVQQKNIPLKVRSFYTPKSKPSIISNQSSEDDKIHKIIVKSNQVLLSIASRDLSFVAEENLTRIFNAFSRHKIHINLMQHSAVSFSVCFAEDKEKLDGLLKDLGKEFSLKYNSGLSLITIRHYTAELIEQHTSGRKIFLEQRSRSTIQLLVR